MGVGQVRLSDDADLEFDADQQHATKASGSGHQGNANGEDRHGGEDRAAHQLEVTVHQCGVALASIPMRQDSHVAAGVEGPPISAPANTIPALIHGACSMAIRGRALRRTSSMGERAKRPVIAGE
ncbi:hypothetical protein A4G26_22710 [Mycobacterium kansasii]|nr:hypothetical protein A4G26_22710 [Mycobacterium kansasii]